MSTETKYCYSDDQEQFWSADATTREGAVEEARHERLNDREPGEAAIVWVGVQRDARTLLDTRHASLGEHFCDTMEEWLADDIAWDDRIVHLSKDDRAALGKLVVDFVAERGGFKAYGVREITEHEVTVPEDEPTTQVA